MAKTILRVLKELTGNTTARTIGEILPELIEGSHYGVDIFSPKGKVRTVSALPATGNQIGDMYHVEEDQGEYAWWPTEAYPNGHWEFIGTVGGSGLPAVTDNDAEKTLLVDEEGNWEVDYPSSSYFICTWTRTVNGNSVSWSCNRTYAQMIANRNTLHRQVVFQYEDQSVIATFHHESGESDYFAGHLIFKDGGQYRKATLYCISGLGVSATEERIMPSDIGAEPQKLTVVITESSGTYTGNKTFAEMWTAYHIDHKLVTVEMGDAEFVLSAADPSMLAFTSASVGSGNATLSMLTVDDNNDWSYEEFAAGLSTTTIASTTPTIAPAANTVYNCGELTSLAISNPPATGAYSVVFTSGATATTTTIPATILGLESFAPEANTLYEINVLDNRAVVGSWAVTV